MAWPAIAVEVAFGDPPLTAIASNTWTDITPYVKTIATRRGRSSALNRTEAGTASLVLDNSDRRFDPTYTSGAYYPDVVPMVKLRISAVYSAVTYYLFTGYVESWPPLGDWAGGLDVTTTIRCVDAFKYFALKKLNGAYGNEFVNWSIDTWLTNIDWPAADRDLWGAASQVQSGTFVNTPALQHFQNAVEVESGLIFMAGNGRVQFQDRFYRLTHSLSSAATFDDLTGAALPYLSVTSSYDDQQIWNEARITRTGGTEQVAEDLTSQAAYFARTYVKTLPVLTDAEALSLAQWIVAIYAYPFFQFTSMTLDGLMDDALWPHILAREISERITVKQRPPPITTAVEQDCYIESVAHQIDAREDGTYWRVTFGLSSADALSGGSFWVLDSATLSVLDSTTRLAY